MTTPQDIIRAWCASCGMAEPSNGECLALKVALAASQADELNRLFVDALAQEIRRVDGSNSLGAGALAEALMPFLCTGAQ